MVSAGWSMGCSKTKSAAMGRDARALSMEVSRTVLGGVASDGATRKGKDLVTKELIAILRICRVRLRWASGFFFTFSRVCIYKLVDHVGDGPGY